MSHKVKGIYDALDLGNYKSAVKLCEGFLKKQANHALCKSLYAVALERCGRMDEALQVCGETQLLPDADETVFNTLQVVYRRCRQRPEILKMYERASEKSPENEEYATAMFVSAVCCRSFAKGQQVAMKLYKKFSKRKYLHWSIATLLLQSSSSDGTDSKAVDLAAMMLMKAPVSPEQADIPETSRGQQYLLLLHLETLYLQKKYDKALELLQACSSYLKMPGDLQRIRLHFCEQLGRQQECLQEARSLYLLDVESWGAAEEYVKFALTSPADSAALPTVSAKLADGKSVELQNHHARLHEALASLRERHPESMEDVESMKFADEAANALILLRYLQREAHKAEGKVCRVPFLAELELRRKLFSFNEGALINQSETSTDWRQAVVEKDIEDFVHIVAEYIKRHYKRNCCYADLKPFLSLLEGRDLAAVMEEIPIKDPAGYSVATHARLKRALSRGSPEALAEVDRLLEVWLHQGGCLDAAKDDTTVKVVAGHEDILVLAVVWLIEADYQVCSQSDAGSSRRFLFDALALAKLGIDTWPEVYHFKVLLVFLYASLGLPTLLMKWYPLLEPKNIQHESISYLALDGLRACGAFDRLRELCHRIQDFHEDHDKDVAEAVSLAFHGSVIQRVPEYLDSMARLAGSAAYGHAVVEDVLCEMGQAQSQESLTEYLGRQGTLLRSLASRGPGEWVEGNQDRSILQGLVPLPSVSPSGVETFRLATPPRARTQWLHSSQPRAIGSAAGFWHASAASSNAATTENLPSAVERLLQGKTDTNWLRLHVLLLHATRLLFWQDGQSKQDELHEAMAAAKEALAQQGAAFSEEQVPKAPDVDVSAVVGPWCSVLEAYRPSLLKCSYLACESARLATASIGGAGSWEAVEKSLAAMEALLRICLEGIHGSAIEAGAGGASAAPTASPSGAAAFALAAGGVPLLAAFLRGPATLAASFIVWACSNLPKAGSGKKAKQGQERLHAVRSAVRSIASLLQAGFTAIGADLAAAATADSAEPSEDLRTRWTGSEPKLPTLAAVPNFDSLRQQALASAGEAHAKHLQALREGLTVRLALLKTQAGFKP